MSEVAFRPAALGDVDVICAQREALFLEAGHPAELVARFSGPSRVWHAEKLAEGRYLGWLAEAKGEVVGGAGMYLLDWCPGPCHPEADRRPVLMNVWVEPAHRRLGLAKALMGEAEAEQRRLGLPYAVLHASDAGRPLYESLNWQATNEMSLALTP